MTRGFGAEPDDTLTRSGGGRESPKVHVLCLPLLVVHLVLGHPVQAAVLLRFHGEIRGEIHVVIRGESRAGTIEEVRAGGVRRRAVVDQVDMGGRVSRTVTDQVPDTEGALVVAEIARGQVADIRVVPEVRVATVALRDPVEMTVLDPVTLAAVGRVPLRETTVAVRPAVGAIVPQIPEMTAVRVGMVRVREVLDLARRVLIGQFRVTVTTVLGEAVTVADREVMQARAVKAVTDDHDQRDTRVAGIKVAVLAAAIRVVAAIRAVAIRVAVNEMIGVPELDQPVALATTDGDRRRPMLVRVRNAPGRVNPVNGRVALAAMLARRHVTHEEIRAQIRAGLDQTRRLETTVRSA